MKTKLLFLLLLSCVTPFYPQQQFWGTASEGGLYDKGFIFKTDSIGDNLEIVHSFQTTVDGENIGALLHASNNKLYGLAASGGANAVGVYNGGTFFEYDLATDQFTVLQHFGPANTALPNTYIPRGEGFSGLTEVSPGVIYGLMRQGEYIFSYNVATGTFSVPFTIPNYNGGATNGILRNRFNKALIKGTDGFLYTTTYTNSTCPIPNPYMGSIIRVNPNTNALSILYKSGCLGDNGYYHNGNLIEANGKLYETTQYGGLYNRGVLYEFNPVGNVFTKKHDFNGGTLSYSPSSLVSADNGKLYGTAYGGGISEPNLPSGGGVLYEFDLATNTFAVKYNFLLNNSWIQDMGVFPRGLIKGVNGKLYGVTEYGVFEYDTVTEENRIAGRFMARGYAPSLLQICRKPSYHLSTNSTLVVTVGSSFTFDLESENTTSVIWKHNGSVDSSQTSTVLSFPTINMTDFGTWVAELTNECGTTVTQSIVITNSLSTEESLARKLFLTPNPVGDRIHFSDDVAINSMMIITMNGQIVAQNKNSNSIKTSGLAKGVYVIKVETNEGVWKEKFVKE